MVFILSVSYVAYNKIFNNERDWSKFYERKSLIHFKGIITDKYVNYKKRALNTIVINDEYHYELLGVWEKKFEIGDYAYKEKGSLDVFLIKQTGDTLIFNYRDIEIKDK